MFNFKKEKYKTEMKYKSFFFLEKYFEVHGMLATEFL